MRACTTACATPRSPLRQRSHVRGGSPGRQRRIFPSGAPAVSRSGRFPFLAWPSRGGALGHEGTSPALAMSGDLSVTPRVTTCTGPSVEDRPAGWDANAAPRRDGLSRVVDQRLLT